MIPPKASAARNGTRRPLLNISITERITVVVLYFRFQESPGKPFRLVVVFGTLPEARPRDPRRAMAPKKLAVFILAGNFVNQKILQRDRFFFHTEHFGDVRNLARTIAQTRRLHDDVNRPADHLTNSLDRKRITTLHDHRFETAQCFARAVGVQRPHRTVVARIHSLQEVERFRSTNLADDDPLGPHTKTILDKIPHPDLAFAFEVRRTRFETHNMRLLQLELGRIFASDDALIVIDRAGKAVEQCRLARTRAAGNDDVAPNPPDDLQHRFSLWRDRAEFHKLLESQAILLEFPNGQHRPIDSERRRDDVDARPVRKARIAYRTRLINAASDLADDALADIHQLLIVGEANARFLNFAADFDKRRVGTVDHDVGDVIASQKRFERPIAQDVVADVLEQFFLLRNRHHDVLDLNDLADDVADFFARGDAVELRKLGEIDGIDQRVEDGCFDVVIFFRVLALRVNDGLRPLRLRGSLLLSRLGRGLRLSRCHRRLRRRRLLRDTLWQRRFVRAPAEHDATSLTLELQLLEERRKRRERRICRSLGLDFLTARHLERYVMKRFDRLGFGVQLPDHLAIVGRLAERFAIVIDDG